MKILLISNFFPPVHTAGTENRTLGYALKLLELGHEVQVVCAGNWEIDDHYWNGFDDETYRQIPVRRIHLNWTLAPDPNRYLYDNPMIEEHFSQWLVNWAPDIVHITSCGTLSASVIRAAKKRKLPVILTLTDYWFICPKTNLIRGDGSLCNGRTTSWDCLKCLLWNTKVYRGLKSIMPEKSTAGVLKLVSHQPKISRNPGFRGMALDMDDRKSQLTELIHSVDCLTAPSEFLRNMFEGSGVSKPIQVILSGHDLSWLETYSRKKKSQIVRFGFIGQIIPIKGLHLLISAFKKASLLNKARLLIYGSLNHNNKYGALIDRLCVGQSDAIKFMDTFPHHQLGEVLSQIDILIVPSQWHENNPRVIQEAFASKTPVIASNVGGIAEFVKSEVNGLLFTRGNADDLAQQLIRVVSDPSIINRLREGIPPTKTVEEEVNEFLDIYLNLLSF
jgi:glycosyltransferase involved in cell wall biosynthesis